MLCVVLHIRVSVCVSQRGGGMGTKTRETLGMYTLLALLELEPVEGGSEVAGEVGFRDIAT